jgi:hypothetical protein
VLLAVGNALSDNRGGGLDAGPITGRTESVYAVAERTVKSAKENRLKDAAKIGRNKAVPPKGAATVRATGRLPPWIFAPGPRQGIDVYCYTEYQGMNSWLGGCPCSEGAV